MNTAKSEKVRAGGGFFAALDQSGGSTPKALAEYGVQEDRYHSDKEMFERQEFAFEAALRMRNRFLQQEVWERLGVDVKEAIRTFAQPDEVKNQDPFQQLLFSKIVPNCKKLGLLDANDGWLRQKFGELGVIQFEDWVDTGAEYDEFSIQKEIEASRAEAAPA